MNQKLPSSRGTKDQGGIRFLSPSRLRLGLGTYEVSWKSFKLNFVLVPVLICRGSRGGL